MTTTNLFANAQTTALNNSSRALAGTAQLTAMSDAVAKKIYEASKATDAGIETIAKSMVEPSIIDRMIEDLGELQTLDYTFLLELADDQMDSMLKSQQSKRSRCKSKVMTEENYLNMMSAAIAEHLIRLASGKTKGSTGRGVAGANVVFTEERLAALAADQEALKKEIRNVQSKKSIMKSKADFKETDERWQHLLVAEVQLKGIRVGGGTTKVTEYVDTTRDTIREMLAEVDIASIKVAQAKELLEAIRNYVFAEED